MNPLLTAPDSTRLQDWLEQHPERLEPGLCIIPGELRLEGGGVVPVCGSDACGRPCLVSLVDRPTALAWDHLLDAAGEFRFGALGADSAFLRGREPRVLLVAREWAAGDRARVSLLHGSVAIRGYQWSVGSEGAPDLFALEMVVPAPHHGFPEQSLSGLGETDAAFVRRLLHLVRQGLGWSAQGEDWPLLLGPAGRPRAALHLEEGRLCLVVATKEGASSVVRPINDEQQDVALDHLMRLAQGL